MMLSNGRRWTLRTPRPWVCCSIKSALLTMLWKASSTGTWTKTSSWIQKTLFNPSQFTEQFNLLLLKTNWNPIHINICIYIYICKTSKVPLTDLTLKSFETKGWPSQTWNKRLILSFHIYFFGKSKHDYLVVSTHLEILVNTEIFLKLLY